MRAGVAERCGAREPGQRLFGILRHAAALVVQYAEVVLRCRVAFIGSRAVAAHGFGQVRGDAGGAFVHDAEIVVRRGVIIGGQRLEYLQCPGGVTRFDCRRGRAQLDVDCRLCVCCFHL